MTEHARPMTQGEATTLLCDAKRLCGEPWLRAMLPAPFVLHQIADHSTGRQITIAAKAEGLPSIDVWRGSVWYSAAYLFNDRHNPPGIQPGCHWAAAPLARYFETVKAAYEEQRNRRESEDTRLRLAAEAERAAAASKYAAMVGATDA